MNTELIILQNLYDSGCIKYNDKLNKFTFYTENNDYIIDFIKEEKRFTFNSDYKYKCRIIFRNILGNILFEIDCTEIEISELLDNFVFLQEFGNDIMYFSFPVMDSNMKQYMFIFNYVYSMYDDSKYDTRTIWSRDDHYSINVTEYDKYTETVVSRANILFTIEGLNQFMDMMYVVFLEGR